MCLPYCPTYTVYQNEAESPRGRISLIQAFARGQLTIDSRAYEHLDHCLGCLACEAMCPSKVPYGRLLDQAKSLLHQTSSSYIFRRILETNTKPDGINRLGKIASLLKQSGLIRLVAKLPSKRIQAGSQVIASSDPVKLHRSYPATQSTAGNVLLYTGCMNKSFDGRALQSSIQLLNHYGFNVLVPKDQYCCGALHLHNGQADQAKELESRNCELFERTSADFIIHTSNGCGAHLESYPPAFKIMDIASFLLHKTAIQTSDFKPLDDSIMIHESCSTQNKLKTGGTSKLLLEHIPDIKLFNFEKPTLCCGAGGAHFINYPELSNMLLVEKLSQLESSSVKYLVSDNIGCSLHYKTGLAKMGLNIKVMHPVSLLAMQLKTRLQ